MDSEDRARCPILSCGTYLMLERTREGTRAGEGEGGRAVRYCRQLRALQVLRKRGGGTHAASAPTAFLGLQDFAKTLGVQFGECFGAEVEAALEAGLRGGSVPSTLVASLCVLLRVECLPAPAARSLSARSAPAGGGVRLPGSQGERGHGAHDRWLESFTLLARGCRLLLPRTSPVFSQGGNRRHFAADNEILAANCSRGRCPSGKARGEGSKHRQEGEAVRGMERKQLLHRLLEAHWLAGGGGRGMGTGGGRQGGGVCKLTFLAACGRGAAVSRCPTFTQRGWLRVRLRGCWLE